MNDEKYIRSYNSLLGQLHTFSNLKQLRVNTLIAYPLKHLQSVVEKCGPSLEVVEFGIKAFLSQEVILMEDRDPAHIVDLATISPQPNIKAFSLIGSIINLDQDLLFVIQQYPSLIKLYINHEETYQQAVYIALVKRSTKNTLISADVFTDFLCYTANIKNHQIHHIPIALNTLSYALKEYFTKSQDSTTATTVTKENKRSLSLEYRLEPYAIFDIFEPNALVNIENNSIKVTFVHIKGLSQLSYINIILGCGYLLTELRVIYDDIFKM